MTAPAITGSFEADDSPFLTRKGSTNYLLPQNQTAPTMPLLINGGATCKLWIPAFSAVSIPDGSGIQVTWTNPTDALWTSTLIMKCAGRFPNSPVDPRATQLYKGTGTSYFDGAVAPLSIYYYAAFGINDTPIFPLSLSAFLAKWNLTDVQTDRDWMNNGRMRVAGIWGWSFMSQQQALNFKDYAFDDFMYGDGDLLQPSIPSAGAQYGMGGYGQYGYGG